MAAPKFEVLETTNITVDDIEYLVTAMPATKGLMFIEKHQAAIDEGKADLSQMKQIICNYVSKENMQITEKSFDIHFSRKYAHLNKLYKEVLNFNFEELFQAPDTEEA
jgi:hypothetical protein